ncbi:hypothetical protein MTO96_032962 [Rhipicephalus appendiculatus]
MNSRVMAARHLFPWRHPSRHAPIKRAYHRLQQETQIQRKLPPAVKLGWIVAAPKKSQKRRKRQPASSTLMTQLLDEQRQLRLSLESRRERELQLKEEQLNIFKDIAAMDKKLLSVLEAIANK